MTARAWWLLAVAAAAVISVVVLGLGTGIGIRFAVGTAILVAFVAFWAIVARPDEEDTTRSIVVLAVAIAVAGALTAVDSSLAFFQTIVFPAAWTLVSTIRRAVIGCAALSLVVTIGFVIPIRGYSTPLPVALAIEGLSFLFAIAMGVWITRIAALGNERKRLLDELTAAQGELAVMHRDSGVTSERQRLARELHDTIAQSLAGLVLLSQRSRRELAAGTLDDDTLELIESGAREALAETRSLVAGSAPVELNGGIAAALTRLGERFARETGIEVTNSAAIDPGAALGRDSEVVLLRCAQEGLANVRKHAGAGRARLELTVARDSATIRVSDDGHGFDPSAVSAGFGLSGLRDRLGLVGGSIAIDGTAGATVLTARLPLAEVSA